MQNQGKNLPLQAKSAVDFQKVWRPISLHARVSGNLTIPVIYSGQQWTTRLKKSTNKIKLCWDSKHILRGFDSDVTYNSILFLILFFGFCPTQNSQVTGGPWTMSRCIKYKNTSLLLVHSKINTTRSTCDWTQSPFQIKYRIMCTVQGLENKSAQTFCTAHKPDLGKHMTTV